MKSRPIIFRGDMVRAIREGRKTQTRRVVKPTAKGCTVGVYSDSANGPYECVNVGDDGDPIDSEPIRCPYGVPGDELWVREAWRTVADIDKVNASGMARRAILAGYAKPWAPMLYEADGARCEWMKFDGLGGGPGRYRHARFMPRWASRLTLVVESVRVERLSAISNEDAKAEGVRTLTKDGSVVKYAILDKGDMSSTAWADMERNPRDAYLRAFRAMHKLAADADPWLWVIGFRKQGGAK